jgi:hypothetical protein
MSSIAEKVEPMEYFTHKNMLQPEYFLAFALALQGSIPAILGLAEKDPMHTKCHRARNYEIYIKNYRAKKGLDAGNSNFCLALRPIGKLEKRPSITIRQSLAAKIAAEKGVIDITNRASLVSSMHTCVRFFQQFNDAKFLWNEAIRLNLIKPEVHEQIQLVQAMLELRNS